MLRTAGGTCSEADKNMNLFGNAMDRRVEKTRKAIIDSLSFLMSKKEYQGITVADITPAIKSRQDLIRVI